MRASIVQRHHRVRPPAIDDGIDRTVHVRFSHDRMHMETSAGEGGGAWSELHELVILPRFWLFRFTTGALDKNAYRISTPTATTGVRGTVLDIDARSSQSRVTLVEGQAIVCPRKPGITFDQQVRNCTKPTGGFGGPHPGGSPCLFTDGSVRTLAYGMDGLLLCALWGWNDGVLVADP